MKNCRICDNTNLEILFETDLKYDYLKNLSNINISSCINCGFCFNSKITQNDCNNYYENTNMYTDYLFNTSELQYSRYSHLKNLLINLNINENDEIIDLTSSDGSLLQYLKYLGYNNLTYCDISEKNIEYNKLFYKNSIKINILDINAYKEITKKFKLIFLNHTLEHIADTDILFTNIKLLMDDESLLYIEVPDIDIDKDICINGADTNQFIDICYEHINFFNIDSLNNICKKNNFNKIENGYLKINYRLHKDIKSLYGVYKLTKIKNNFTIYYEDKTKKYLINYIKRCLDYTDIIYNQIDKTKKYSIYGFGVYAMFFLSFYKDIEIVKIYDDIKYGIYNNIQLTNINNYNENENILILNPNYYELLYNKLVNLKIKVNIYELKY